MYPVVTTVQVIPPYGLRLTFTDGSSGDIDFRARLYLNETRESSLNCGTLCCSPRSG